MILQEYRKIKRRWELSTCWKDSPLSILAENNNESDLIPFWRQKQASLEYYNRLIKIMENELKKEIAQCEERLKIIIKSKNLKELRKIEKLTAIYIHSNDFETIKGRLMVWYKTKIKHDKQELGSSSHYWSSI